MNKYIPFSVETVSAVDAPLAHGDGHHYIRIYIYISIYLPFSVETGVNPLPYLYLYLYIHTHTVLRRDCVGGQAVDAPLTNIYNI